MIENNLNGLTDAEVEKSKSQFGTNQLFRKKGKSLLSMFRDSFGDVWIKIICAALIFLSGVLYSVIPSGYNEDGIFLNGRFYPFHKIKDMKISVADDKMMLEFKYGRGSRMLFSSIEEKRKLDQCLNIYLNVMIIPTESWVGHWFNPNWHTGSSFIY